MKFSHLTLNFPGVAFDLSDKELFCVEEQDVFDRVYSLVKGFSLLSPSSKFNLVETLRSNLSVLLPNVDSLSRAPQGSPTESSVSHIAARIASHRNALKIYTYFLLTVVLAEESASQETAVRSKVRTFLKNPSNIEVSFSFPLLILVRL